MVNRSEDSLDSFTGERRPSLVQFCLERNTEHPPGPINTPKGGFVNKCAPPPERGILKTYSCDTPDWISG